MEIEMTYNKVEIKPVYETESIAAAVRKIYSNLSNVGQCLYGRQQTMVEEKIALLEFAVGIEDAEARKAFVSLISKWAIATDRHIEATEGIGKIRQQLDGLLTKLEAIDAKK